MQDCCAPFRGKKITVMGLGLLGRGVGDAEFLARCGANVLVTDKKSEEELTESMQKLQRYSNITFHLGGHRLEDFTSVDMVLKAAGVPLNSPEIAAAKKAGVPVVMSTALFAKYAQEAGATLVGVTGTRGKSTVTHMIAHALIRTNKRIVLGGNVRGVSTLAKLPEVEQRTICVLELDSWQLQGFGDLKFSPRIAVFTNLMPDHLNYYPNMEAYFNDKANIFRYQKEDGFLFVGQRVLERVKAARPPAAPHVPPPPPADWRLKVIGAHNRENASLAAAALRALGLSEQAVQDGLESFEPVEGRLQFVREVNGVKIYNDNNATTPEATIAALLALDRPITLITGGSEKGLDLKELVAVIRRRAARVILLVHPNYRGSERMARELTAADVPFEEAASLERALEQAMGHARGGAIVFSPAFASFGMFKNEYERNDRFLDLVRALR